MDGITTAILVMLLASHFELYRRIGVVSAKVEIILTLIGHKKGGDD
jgi:hypothetical protein